jgi:hypothetical protein
VADNQGRRHACAEASGVTSLPIHILAGGIGRISGCVPLSAAKGATQHRKSGMLFVRIRVSTPQISGTTK